MTANDIRDAIVKILREALANSTSILVTSWETEINEIALDAAHYAVAAAQGDSEAMNLLGHLKVQAELVAARLLLQENVVLKATIENILVYGAQIAAIILRGMA